MGASKGHLKCIIIIPEVANLILSFLESGGNMVVIPSNSQQSGNGTLSQDVSNLSTAFLVLKRKLKLILLYKQDREGSIH